VLTNPKSAYLTECRWRLSGTSVSGSGGNGNDKSSKRVPRGVRIAQVETAPHCFARRPFAPAHGGFKEMAMINLNRTYLAGCGLRR